MSEQIYNDSVEQDTSVSRTQDSTLSNKTNQREINSDPLMKAKVVEEPSFLDKWQNNRFWLIKGSFYLLRSVWMIVMGIGAFIAFIISMLFI